MHLRIGHAAGLLPLLGRGLELCNPPFTNGSRIPNWCTLRGENGSVAQRLLPPLVAEMAELFGSELCHLGGDESCCDGAYDFERRIIATIEGQNKTAMAWSEVESNRAASQRTVIQTWKSPNASALAARGVAAVESAPARFYLSSGCSKPGDITGAWVDLWQGATGTAARNNATTYRHLLGGEVAMWTDAYSSINDCVRPGDGPGPAAELWPRSRDSDFGRSVGGMLWPRGFLAAGSLWNFRPELTPDGLADQALFQHTTTVLRRGGLVCPVGCICNAKSACGTPYGPSPPTPPAPPKPPPPPPAPPSPPSDACNFTQGAGLQPNDVYRTKSATKEACCGICLGDSSCTGAVSNSGICHIKHASVGKLVLGRGNTSFVCMPRRNGQLFL